MDEITIDEAIDALDRLEAVDSIHRALQMIDEDDV